MADNSRNDDFPTIRLDEDDRRTRAATQSRPAPTSGQVAVKSSGGNGLWITLVALIASAGIGGCYYLFMLLQQQQQVAVQAEERIAMLERKLSATGEEIGESTVAIQVKVSELTEKTDELWSEMDKLWASAWRRNQKEITELADKVSANQRATTSSLSDLTKSTESQQNQFVTVSNRLSQIADELLALNLRLEQNNENESKQASQLKTLNDKLTVLEQRSATMASKLNSVDSDLKRLQGSTTSSAGTSSPGPASE